MNDQLKGKIEEKREKALDNAQKSIKLSEKQQKELNEALKELNMPLKLVDNKFVLGDQELDIRSLNSKNYKQLMFRMQAANLAYLRELNQTLVDVMRLIMLVLTFQGCKDIEGELNTLLNKLSEAANKESSKIIAKGETN